MKKLLLTLALFCATAYGQIDIRVTNQIGSPIIIGRGLGWGASGLNKVNNNFIVTGINPNQGTCIQFFNNNPTNSHTFQVQLSQTIDPAVNSFTNNQARWSLVTSTAVQFNINQTVLASGTLGYYFGSTGASSIVVSVSTSTVQAGSPDTVDIIATQTSSTNCGILQTAINSPSTCPNVVNSAVLAHGASATFLSIPANRNVVVCMVTVSLLTAATVNGSVIVGFAATGSCSGINSSGGWLWGVTPTTPLQPYTTGVGYGWFMTSASSFGNLAGQDFCVRSTATSGTFQVSVAFGIQ